VVGETPRDYRDKLLTDSAKSTDDTS
jgi:hypothetical protein